MTEVPDFERDVDLDVEGPEGAGEDQPTPGERGLPQPERAASPAPSGPPQFAYNQRLYAFGFTGSGKSEILNLLFSGVKCQKILIDNKPEFRVRDVEPVSDPEEIDWREPVIHYQPAPGSDSSQYEAIFAKAFTRRGLLICVHEWGALVDYNPQRAGRYLISYCAQGERLGLGLLSGSTRPRLIPVPGITEASHLLVFGPNFARADDTAAAAEAISPVEGQPMSGYALMQELGELDQPHGFLWKERRTGRLLRMPPLPDHLRSLSIVERMEDA